jgi:quercetin dioxygenase-like cupin family protein
VELPEFIKAFPSADLPIPEEKVSSRAMKSENGLMVIFLVHEDIEIPPHAHLGQWGTVIEGQIELTTGDETRVYGPGEFYDIKAGVVHSARAPAGTKILELFEEPDRYGLKPQAK